MAMTGKAHWLVRVHEAFNMGYIQRDVFAPGNYNPAEVIDRGIAFREGRS
jgi:hypothetical protein